MDDVLLDGRRVTEARVVRMEIERKFLVVSDGYRAVTPQELRQGYLSRAKERNVRVRTSGRAGFLTIKGQQVGLTRPEYEYPIPFEDATQMLERMCERPIIEKRRYVVEFRGKRWEVDEFLGDNAGLVVAEIELQDETEQFEKPEWVGKEVTRDTRYLNANLVQRPYNTWDRP